MTDWKEQTREEKWNAIFPPRLSDDDLQALKRLLQERLPVVEIGEGLDAYFDYAPPSYVSLELWSVARLYQSTCREIHRRSPGFFEGPAEYGVKLAVKILEEYGFKYSGLGETWGYWSRDQGDPDVYLKPISGCRARAIFAKKRRFMESASTEEEIWKYVNWEIRFPWRRLRSLRSVFHLGELEEFTKFWNAIDVLSRKEHLDELLLPPLENEEPTDPRYLALEAMQLGYAVRALEAKEHEPDTLRGKKVIASSAKGGEGRRGRLAQSTLAVLDEMERLRAAGHSINRSAELVAANGIGRSQAANRALWYAHRR